MKIFLLMIRIPVKIIKETNDILLRSLDFSLNDLFVCVQSVREGIATLK